MIMPLGDDNSMRRTTPYVVYGLVAANILVFLLQMGLGDRFTYAFSAVPFEITHNQDLTQTVVISSGGERIGIPQFPGPFPIQITLLTSMFMHGSLMHIGGNMLYLWIFGDQIEDLLGHWRFLAFYLVCGFAADAAHIAGDVNSIIPTLGASGAISGVLGAYLVKYPTNRVRVLMLRIITEVPAYVALGFWIVIQVFSQLSIPRGSVGSGVAYLAHIGGFVAGVVLVFVFAIGAKPEEPPRRRW